MQRMALDLLSAIGGRSKIATFEVKKKKYDMRLIMTHDYANPNIPIRFLIDVDNKELFFWEVNKTSRFLNLLGKKWKVPNQKAVEKECFKAIKKINK
jgi:hypothetical protein